MSGNTISINNNFGAGPNGACVRVGTPAEALASHRDAIDAILLAAGATETSRSAVASMINSAIV